jgi:hypothetical protein
MEVYLPTVNEGYPLTVQWIVSGDFFFFIQYFGNFFMTQYFKITILLISFMTLPIET